METKTAVSIVRCTPSVQDATRLAALGFNQPISPELELDVHQHLEAGDLIYSVIDDDRIVGFVVFNVWDEVLYLSGIIVDPHYRGHQITRAAIARACEAAPGVSILALRTQSLRMYHAGERACQAGHWYPASSQRELPQHLEIAGQMVASRIDSAFPVHVGCYNGPLYGSKPTATTLQSWWDDLCDFQRGDAVICIGELKS